MDNWASARASLNTVTDVMYGRHIESWIFEQVLQRYQWDRIIVEVDLSSGYYQFMVNKLVGRYELFSSSRDVYSRVGSSDHWIDQSRRIEVKTQDVSRLQTKGAARIRSWE